MAPMVLREGIVALGEAAKTFNQARFGELISQVSKEIANESARWQFQAETVREFQKLKGQKAPPAPGTSNCVTASTPSTVRASSR